MGARSAFVITSTGFALNEQGNSFARTSIQFQPQTGRSLLAPQSCFRAVWITAKSRATPKDLLSSKSLTEQGKSSWPFGGGKPGTRQPSFSCRTKGATGSGKNSNRAALPCDQLATLQLLEKTWAHDLHPLLLGGNLEG